VRKNPWKKRVFVTGNGREVSRTYTVEKNLEVEPSADGERHEGREFRKEARNEATVKSIFEGSGVVVVTLAFTSVRAFRKGTA